MHFESLDVYKRQDLYFITDPPGYLPQHAANILLHGEKIVHHRVETKLLAFLFQPVCLLKQIHLIAGIDLKYLLSELVDLLPEFRLCLLYTSRCV